MPKLTLAELEERVGQEVGLSPWLEMTQDRINAFAECTEDRQWIHVNEEQARKSPLRSTVAHGYLLVSLLAHFNLQIEIFQQEFRMAINYGLDHVRFLNPVRPGDRIRSRALLKTVEKQGLRKVLITVKNTLEIEGVDRPALIAEALALIYL
ncbi:MAG: MaoC family dehydratase [Candidatus Aminicenantaceae bacterium]|jgi:acyl dehydratase